MRAVDMDAHRVVCRGIPWPSDCAPPSAKDMLARLERNEALVSWLQPNGGGVEDQFPAIQVGAVFYTISLRMMKAVWRHVRLKRGFVNRETVPHVGVRLRIPTLLLCEKIRTQQRFNMMRVKQRVVEGEAGGTPGVDDGTGKRRRKDVAVPAGDGALASPKTVPAVAGAPGGNAAGGNFRDMLWVVENWIVSAEPAAGCALQQEEGDPSGRAAAEEGGPADPPPRKGAWAGFTRFRLDETELFENLMYQMRRDCPRLCSGMPPSSTLSLA